MYMWNVFVCLRNLGPQCSRLHVERKHGSQRKRKRLLNISKTHDSFLKVVSLIPTSNAMMHIKSCLLQLLALAQSQWEDIFFNTVPWSIEDTATVVQVAHLIASVSQNICLSSTSRYKDIPWFQTNYLEPISFNTYFSF